MGILNNYISKKIISEKNLDTLETEIADIELIAGYFAKHRESCYNNIYNAVYRIVDRLQPDDKLFTLEEAFKILDYVVKDAKNVQKEENTEMPSLNGVGEKIIGYIVTNYKNEIENNPEIAEELSNIMSSHSNSYSNFRLNANIRYDTPMASNFANHLVYGLLKIDATIDGDKITPNPQNSWLNSIGEGYGRYSQDLSFNASLMESITDKNIIEYVKPYMNYLANNNHMAVVYHAVSNPMFDDEFRNQLFETMVKARGYITEVFKNPTEEMTNVCKKAMLDILGGRDVKGISPFTRDSQLFYIAKSCPELFTKENILKEIENLGDKEKTNALNAIVEHNEFKDLRRDEEFMKSVYDMVKNTRHYQDMQNPLYERNSNENRTCSYMNQIEKLNNKTAKDNVIENDSKNNIGDNR